MTEQEWLATTDPIPMLSFVEGKASDRQLRLFVTACCSQVWSLLDHTPSKLAIDVASRYTDHQADRDELDAARRTVEGWEYGYHLEKALASAVCQEPPHLVQVISNSEQLLTRQYEVERKVHRAKAGTVPTPRYTAMIRDIIGNPFHAVAFASEWRTDTSLGLARHLYERLDFSIMPILADALQDAGCDSDEILNHCRDEGQVHVRGCWVLDGLLGKS